MCHTLLKNVWHIFQKCVAHFWKCVTHFWKCVTHFWNFGTSFDGSWNHLSQIFETANQKKCVTHFFDAALWRIQGGTRWQKVCHTLFWNRFSRFGKISRQVCATRFQKCATHFKMCHTFLKNVSHIFKKCVTHFQKMCDTFLKNVWHIFEKCVAHFKMCGTFLKFWYTFSWIFLSFLGFHWISIYFHAFQSKIQESPGKPMEIPAEGSFKTGRCHVVFVFGSPEIPLSHCYCLQVPLLCAVTLFRLHNSRLKSHRNLYFREKCQARAILLFTGAIAVCRHTFSTLHFAH